MAGHSKWANIKHRKAAQDKKRGKIFTRIIRELMVAAKAGGGDPGTNPALRLAMDNARAENMPKDTMERAIKRGTGEIEGADYEEVVYEGYGPGNVAVMVKCLTDNRARTAAKSSARPRCPSTCLAAAQPVVPRCSPSLYPSPPPCRSQALCPSRAGAASIHEDRRRSRAQLTSGASPPQPPPRRLKFGQPRPRRTAASPDRVRPRAMSCLPRT